MTDSNKINGKSRRTLISILIVVFALTLVGGTLAYLIFGMDILNGNYISKTKCFNFSYSNTFNNQQITGELMPSNKDKGGISGTVSIASSCNVEAKGNLLFKVNASSAVLASQVAPHCENANTLETLNYNETECNNADNAVWVTNGSALKYSVYDNTTGEHFASGYANTTGEAIKMYKNFIIPSDGSVVDFSVYIWLDANLMDDSYSDVSLSGYVYADATQNFKSMPNAPELDPTMIPVKIADDGTVTTVSANDPSWYNYGAKKWANVVLVNEEATSGVTNSHSRSYYKSNIGQQVTQGDILAYYVWVPRYKYRISTNKSCGDIKGVNPNDYPSCYKKNYTVLDELLAKAKIEQFLNDSGAAACHCGFNDSGFSCSDSVKTRILNNLISNGKQNVDCFGTLYIADVLTEGEDYKSKDVLILNNLAPESIMTPGTIDIEFELKEDLFDFGNATSQYRSHSAFWVDDDLDKIVDDGETLSGFWMPKFEPSAYKSVSQCAYGEDIDGDGLLDGEDIVGEGNPEDYECPEWIEYDSTCYVPMKSSSSNVTWGSGGPFGSQLSNTFMFEFENQSTKKQMMNNKEWGAVAYLSHSNYGINEEVRINNTNITGCGASSPDASAATNYDNPDSCAIKYGSGVSSYPQSTTGNITGVFDMSGGRWEFVIQNIDYEYDDLSGMTTFDEIQCDAKICDGQAFSETKNWYNDLNPGGIEFVGELDLYRGARYDSGQSAGVFAYQFEDGTSYGEFKLYITRETIIVKK